MRMGNGRGLTRDVPRGGVAILAAALWLGGCGSLRQPTVQSAGQPVRGASGAYELTPAPGWQRVAPRPQSDLTLMDVGTQAGVVVWYYPGAKSDMDKLVAWRRAEIFKRGVQEYSESRFFLPEADLVPASLARYGFPGSTGPNAVVTVLTVVTERGAIEIVGGSSSAEQETQLNAVLTSLRIVE